MDVVVWVPEGGSMTKTATNILEDLKFTWDTDSQQYVRLRTRYRDTLACLYFGSAIFFQCKRKKR